MFHGAPNGYAQNLYAPQKLIFTPMQIGTNDGTGRKGTDANPWIVPAIKRAGGKTPSPKNAPFSPLLECPCTDRIKNLHVNGDCRPEPLSDLLVTKNPTCNTDTYVGGLNCCPDKGFLLDSNQTVPAFVDHVFYRFRFYFEEYDPAKYQLINHLEWAGNGCDSGCGKCPNRCGHIEWDVVQGQGSDEGADVSKFQSTFPAGNMLASSCAPTDAQCMDIRTVNASKGFKLIMAATHCHAPNCIRQELINKDTGEMLCYGVPTHGQSFTEIYNEMGYLSTPPCLRGEQEDLVDPPVLMLNTTLQMISSFNSTYWHPGQMGIWHMQAPPVV